MTNNQLLTNIFVIIFFHFILAQFAILDCFYLSLFLPKYFGRKKFTFLWSYDISNYRLFSFMRTMVVKFIKQDRAHKLNKIFIEHYFNCVLQNICMYN